MEFKINENGEVIETFGDMMRALSHLPKDSSPKKKKKEEEEEESLGKSMLIMDMPKSCFDCPCCDGEYAFCTALKDAPECPVEGYLDECPLIPVDINGLE